MDSFDQLCNEFHHFIFHEIKSDVEIYVKHEEFDAAINFLKRIEIFVEMNYRTLYLEAKFKFKFIQNNPNFLHEIEGLKKWVEVKKSEYQKETPEVKESESNEPTKPKYHAKFYAFYHWVKIDLGLTKVFNRDLNDKWPADAIMKFAEEEYKFNDGQSFYREFREQGEMITNRIAIARHLKTGYKKKIEDISNKDKDIIEYLGKWPN